VHLGLDRQGASLIFYVLFKRAQASFRHFFFKTLIFQFWSNWVAGWLGMEDKLVQWFGLDQSKYQWAIDEYMDRQLVSFSFLSLSLSVSLSLCLSLQ
jgi:hypothetical protein